MALALEVLQLFYCRKCRLDTVIHHVMSRNPRPAPGTDRRSQKFYFNLLQSRTTISESDCDPRRSFHFLFCFCNPLPLHHSQESTLAPLQVRQSAFAQSNSKPTYVICAIKRKIYAILTKKGAAWLRHNSHNSFAHTQSRSGHSCTSHDNERLPHPPLTHMFTRRKRIRT